MRFPRIASAFILGILVWLSFCRQVFSDPSQQLRTHYIEVGSNLPFDFRHATLRKSVGFPCDANEVANGDPIFDLTPNEAVNPIIMVLDDVQITVEMGRNENYTAEEAYIRINTERLGKGRATILEDGKATILDCKPNESPEYLRFIFLCRRMQVIVKLKLMTNSKGNDGSSSSTLTHLKVDINIQYCDHHLEENEDPLGQTRVAKRDTVRDLFEKQKIIPPIQWQKPIKQIQGIGKLGGLATPINPLQQHEVRIVVLPILIRETLEIGGCSAQRKGTQGMSEIGGRMMQSKEKQVMLDIGGIVPQTKRQQQGLSDIFNLVAQRDEEIRPEHLTKIVLGLVWLGILMISFFSIWHPWNKVEPVLAYCMLFGMLIEFGNFIITGTITPLQTFVRDLIYKIIIIFLMTRGKRFSR